MESSRPSPAKASVPYTKEIATPFSQSWIQALTLVADNPLARTVKPQLEWINTLSRSRAEADRSQAAVELWEVAKRDGLIDLLDLLPVRQVEWSFPSDERFLLRRRNSNHDVLATTVDTHNPSVNPNASLQPNIGPPSLSFEQWRAAIGLEPLEIALTAEVFSGDWASLVRSEAVRLQQSLNLSAVPQSTTLHLPCTARWDTKCWSLTFDQVDWVTLRYDELPVMPRPSYPELEEKLTWLLAAVGDSLINKKAPNCKFIPPSSPWEGCVESLQPLHETVRSQSTGYAPWFLRTWYCVWPIVYREQHVLHDRADLEELRRELKACLDSQPRLCLSMFLLAKLICQTQLSTGLGFCADFGD